jgi:hypothetical protein
LRELSGSLFFFRSPCFVRTGYQSIPVQDPSFPIAVADGHAGLQY